MPESNESNTFSISPSISILVAGILIAGSIVFVNRYPAPTVDVEQPTTVVNIPLPSQSDHRMGSLTAPLVLVEYSDFQCPFCALIHPTLKKIVDESNGKIAWVYRHFPLESIHPHAKPAALAAECIAEQLGDTGFWKFADALFADQSKMSSTYYAQLATQFGANKNTFSACVASEKYVSKIDSESADAQKNGGQGTPYTVVVGKKLQIPFSGALPYAQIMSVIKAVESRQ